MFIVRSTSHGHTMYEKQVTITAQATQYHSRLSCVQYSKLHLIINSDSATPETLRRLLFLPIARVAPAACGIVHLRLPTTTEWNVRGEIIYVLSTAYRQKDQNIPGGSLENGDGSYNAINTVDRSMEF